MQNFKQIDAIQETPNFNEILSQLSKNEQTNSNDALVKPDSFGAWFEADHDFD